MARIGRGSIRGLVALVASLTIGGCVSQGQYHMGSTRIVAFGCVAQGCDNYYGSI